jgi:hypothetical protein
MVDRASIQQPPAFSPASCLRSFVYAGRGIRVMVTSQHNAWIHTAATVATVALGLSLRVPRLEWIALVFYRLCLDRRGDQHCTGTRVRRCFARIPSACRDGKGCRCRRRPHLRRWRRSNGPSRLSPAPSSPSLLRRSDMIFAIDFPVVHSVPTPPKLGVEHRRNPRFARAFAG